MTKSIKVLTFLLLTAGSLLIGDSLLFYAKGYFGQVLLRKAWNKSLLTNQQSNPWPWAKSGPVGRLKIPEIDFDKVIIEGADDGSMIYGSSHLSGTALPGDNGNCVIAGHRDTFFRRLDELKNGDRLFLEGKNCRGWYRITQIEICNPDDIKWLEPLPMRTLTLITCYPFDFIGSAPKRYVIRALPDHSSVTSEKSISTSSFFDSGTSNISCSLRPI